MAEFQEVMKIKQRLCNCDNYDECRVQCPLSAANNKHEVTCTTFICYYPKEAEEIIMKWSEEQTTSDSIKRLDNEIPSKKCTAYEDGCEE